MSTSSRQTPRLLEIWKCVYIYFWHFNNVYYDYSAFDMGKCNLKWTEWKNQDAIINCAAYHLSFASHCLMAAFPMEAVHLSRESPSRDSTQRIADCERECFEIFKCHLEKMFVLLLLLTAAFVWLWQILEHDEWKGGSTPDAEAELIWILLVTQHVSKILHLRRCSMFSSIEFYDL